MNFSLGRMNPHVVFQPSAILFATISPLILAVVLWSILVQLDLLDDILTVQALLPSKNQTFVDYSVADPGLPGGGTQLILQFFCRKLHENGNLVRLWQPPWIRHYYWCSEFWTKNNKFTRQSWKFSPFWPLIKQRITLRKKHQISESSSFPGLFLTISQCDTTN